MKNTKTTGIGIATIVSVLSNLALQFFGGGEITGGDIGAAITAIMSAVGLIFARDAETAETVAEKTTTTTFKTQAIVGAFLLFGLVSVADAACDRRQPYARFSATAQLAIPGQTVKNTILFRNEDSRGCSETCFQLNTGARPPYDGQAMAYVGVPTLQAADGSWFPNVLCLKAGEQREAVYHLPFRADQPAGPSYVVESIIMARTPELYDENWRTNQYDAECVPACVNMSLEQCRAYACCPELPNG